MDTDSTCTGCIATDEATAELCESPCLTVCERRALASMRGVNEQYIFYTETWLCRYMRLVHAEGSHGIPCSSQPLAHPVPVLVPCTRYSESGQITPHYEKAPLDVYLTALLVAMLQLVGGVSTVVPSNTYEYTFFVIAILVGAVLFAAVQGVICGVVTNGDPDEIAWRQNLDALNFMMSDTNLPHRTRLAVRKFFRNSKRLFKRKSYAALVNECLSQDLQYAARSLLCEPCPLAVFALVDHRVCPRRSSTLATNTCQRSKLRVCVVIFRRDVRYQIANGVFQGVWYAKSRTHVHVHVGGCMLSACSNLRRTTVD